MIEVVFLLRDDLERRVIPRHDLAGLQLAVTICVYTCDDVVVFGKLRQVGRDRGDTSTQAASACGDVGFGESDEHFGHHLWRCWLNIDLCLGMPFPVALRPHEYVC